MEFKRPRRPRIRGIKSTEEKTVELLVELRGLTHREAWDTIRLNQLNSDNKYITKVFGE